MGFFDVPTICRMPSALAPLHQLACALGGYNLKLSCCLGCDPRAVVSCMVDTWIETAVVPLNGAKICECLSSNANFKYLLNHQCLQGIQKSHLLKPAPQAVKSRLQIFFQLFSFFEE